MSFNPARSRAMTGLNLHTNPSYLSHYVRWVLGDNSLTSSRCAVLYAWSHPANASVLKRLCRKDRERVIRLVDYEEMGQTLEKYSIWKKYDII
jgi:hypothetical protein